MDTFEHLGRTYRVLAQFTGFDRATEAKQYMRTHPHTVVLCDEGGTTYVIFDADKGRPTEKAPDTWDAGWSSLFSEGGFRFKREGDPQS
jgi:hypothetical protein